MLNFVNKLFGSASKRQIKTYSKTIESINSFEEKLINLSNQELQDKTEYFKNLIKKIKKELSKEKDVLEIGREWRYDLFALDLEMPTPIVQRNLRFEVSERLDFEGKIIKKLDEKEVIKVAKEIKKSGVETLAIVFLPVPGLPVIPIIVILKIN